MEGDKLQFHTLFGEEFTGSSPEDVIETLYQNSKEGMGGITFDQWWAYQSETWQQKYGLTVPPHGEPEASHKLLEIMVGVGALEQGPHPTDNPKSVDGASDV